MRTALIQLIDSIKPTVKKHSPFIVVCGLFLVIGVVLSLTWYRYQLNPDASSYFTIAYKYAHLDIRQAINGYWGPMLSWLLVPAVWLHLNMIIAAKLMATATGLVTLVVAYRFLLAKAVSRTIAVLICAVLAALLLDMATVQSITPDMLMALLVLWFAIRLDGFVAAPTPKRAAILGLIGALMYLTKGFGFYLFIAIVGLVALWQWLCVTKDLKAVVRRYLPLLVVFVVLVAPFIVTFSVKYHRLTVNTAGSFDKNLFGPTSKGIDYPMYMVGPLAPPNSSAVSVWEDPTYITPLIPDAGWKPYSSASNLHYYLNSVVGANLQASWVGLQGFGALVVFGLVVLVIGGLQKKAYQREFILFALISGVTVAGYSLVYVEPRYLLGVALLAAIGAGFGFSMLQKNGSLNYRQVLAVGAILCAAAVLTTTQSIVQGKDASKSYYQTANSLQGVIPPHAKIISDDFNSFALCYFMRAQCYGILTPPATNVRPYYQNLKHLGITYYVDYHTRDTNQALQSFVASYFTPIKQYSSGKLLVTTYRIR